MKTILSIFFITSAVLVSIFFSARQFSCTESLCNFDGIKTQKSKIKEITKALANSQEIEKKRDALSLTYNSISQEDRVRLEALVPNNVDNIKLVLEVETLANKYGLSITSPKLQIQEDKKEVTPTDSTGQAIRTNTAGFNSSGKYGSFVLDFGLTTNYQNLKSLVRDMERNLRLIEITSIEVSVPESIDPKTLKKSPDGVYDVKLKATIYYLKN